MFYFVNFTKKKCYSWELTWVWEVRRTSFTGFPWAKNKNILDGKSTQRNWALATNSNFTPYIFVTWWCKSLIFQTHIISWNIEVLWFIIWVFGKNSVPFCSNKYWKYLCFFLTYNFPTATFLEIDLWVVSFFSSNPFRFITTNLA